MNNVTGNLIVRVKGRQALPRFDQELRKKALGDGAGAIQQLRFVCRIAEDTNEAIANGFTDSKGKRYTPNPKARAQFGRNSSGAAYLTFGVIDPSGKKIRLTWEGESVPMRMKKVAVAHDEGHRISSSEIKLDLSKAIVRESIKKDGRRRKRHDIDKNGVKHPRPTNSRTHARLCAADIREG